MQYLINPRKRKSIAHLWDGNDTYCRLASTGGMDASKSVAVHDLDGRRICNMCNNVFKRRKVESKGFPKHELVDQPDGSLRSPLYMFDVSRWASRD